MMGVILVNVVLMATTFANEAPAFTSGALARATGTQAHTQQTSCACAHPLDLQPRQPATPLSAWCCCWSWLQSWLLRARASTGAATGTSELGSGAARPGLCRLASLQAQLVHLARTSCSLCPAPLPQIRPGSLCCSSGGHCHTDRGSSRWRAPAPGCAEASADAGTCAASIQACAPLQGECCVRCVMQ